MNAFNNVNMSAACIITSLEHARHLRIPESQLIFPLGGAGTHDRENCELTDLREQDFCERLLTI
jgi:hypothetical protein